MYRTFLICKGCFITKLVYYSMNRLDTLLHVFAQIKYLPPHYFVINNRLFPNKHIESD